MARKKNRRTRRERKAARQAAPAAEAPPPVEPVRQAEVPPTPKPEAPPAPPWWAFAGLAVVAVVVRVVYFFEHSASPFFHGLVLDEANYDALGWEMASGGGLWEGVLTFNPLEPLILAGIYSLVGHDLAWPRILQLIADVAMVGGVTVTAGRLIHWRAGLAAGALAAVYGPAIFYAGELLAECWALSFLALSLAAMTGRGWGWRLLAGLLMGLAVLGRPNLVLFYPVLALWWLWSDRLAGLKRIAPMLLGMVLAIAPITGRNIAAGDAVMLTAHGGINLFIGNNPDASGWFKIPRGTGLSGSQQELIESASRAAARESGEELKPSEVSDYWRSEAISFWTGYPVAATGLLLRKGFYFLNGYDKPMVANYHFAQRQSVVLSWLTVGFAPVMILGGVGMLLSWRARRRLAPLYLLVATSAAGVVLFFVSMRYRLPVVAGLLPFAGLALSEAIGWIRQRAGVEVWRAPVMSGALISVAVLWPSVRIAELPGDMAHTHYYLGSVALEQEAPEQAIAHLEDALALVPENVRYRHQYGIALQRADRIAESIAVLEAVTADEPIFLPPYIGLGIAYRKTGDLAAAEATYRRALAVSDRYHFAWYNLGNVLLDQRRLDEAAEAFERAVALRPEFAPAAQALERMGRR